MIRKAGPADLATLAALVERAYAPWVPLLGRRPKPMDDDYAARIAAGEAFLLEREGTLAGAIVLVDAPDHLWVDNVAVDPAAQHRGVGRTLLAFAEAEARRRGQAELRLLTNAGMLRNIALYQRLGYVETAREAVAGTTRVRMAKRLG